MTRFPSWITGPVRRLANRRLGRPARYAGAVILVVLCCALRAQLPSTALPYLFFIPGLMVCGFSFGVGPSILGCTLAVLAAQYFFIGPLGFESDLTSWINSVSFGLVTFAMAAVCALFRKNLDTLNSLNQHLEEEVERRTQERDGIWSVSPDLICTLSASGELLAMNPAWQVETGWSEEELKAGVFSRLIGPEQLSEALGRLNRQPIIELDTQGVRSDGQQLHLNWRIACRPGQLLAVARDITLFKERQDALEQVRSQLQQSQKMEAIGQLTGGLAHDFNNLLTVISGSLEMLQQRVTEGRSGELQRYLTLAQTASERAASLTHRLLAYARRQPLTSKVVDPARLILEMKELISRTLTPRIELQLLAPEKPVLCQCDPHQLENAILNLCINARDAMPLGGHLQLEVSLTHIDSGKGKPGLSAGDYVLIRVRDTGSGMPASVVERAFDPFFTTKPLGSGTGLGLSMVYGFARQSAGEAQISSQVSKGTTVSLLLPAHPGEMPSPSPSAAPARQAPARSQGTVMIVDDEAAIRDLASETLTDVGFHVIKAATAADALQRLDSLADLDLLVTDIGLAGVTGGDALARAAVEANPGLKVLFISGFSESAAPTASFQEGQARLLFKPFSMGEFKATVEQLLESR
ncbi:ATP-binding protein [Phytopseudomonas flavescens]|uniref:ATP-binding protein n=1 Tax=Phytopseudomonas flavescens TaxID=29435 RepID=UPI0014289A26|nr:ATP-binding protein [Pseudomonas flavescens]